MHSTLRALAAVLLLTLAVPASAATLAYQTDLKLWLKADAIGPGDVTGNVVDTWTDSSGNNHHGTKIGNPTLVGNAINGQPAVNFGGIEDAFSLGGGAVGSSQQFTIFAIVTDTSPDDSGLHEVYSNWAGVNNMWQSVFLGTDVGSTHQVRLTDGLYTASGLVSPASFSVLTGVYNGGTQAEVFQNLTSLGSVAVSSDPPQQDPGGSTFQRVLSTPSFVGKQGDSNFEWWQGDIAELLVYDSLLSPNATQQVYSYLHDKYAVNVPEPSSVLLAILGLVGLLCARRWCGTNRLAASESA